MKEFTHPNLIKLYEIMEDKKNEKLYIGNNFFYKLNLFLKKKVIEYASKGELITWDEN